MPLSTIAVAAFSVAVVALGGAGLLIYHKKTNTTKSGSLTSLVKSQYEKSFIKYSLRAI